MQLDNFTRHYLIAALWSSVDDNDNPLDASYGLNDFAPTAVYKAKADCRKFQLENAPLLAGAYPLYAPHPDAPTPECSAGHDFWLTRNGHGAGFWDRGLGPIGDRLADAARAFGEAYLYVGDDNLLYFS